MIDGRHNRTAARAVGVIALASLILAGCTSAEQATTHQAPQLSQSPETTADSPQASAAPRPLLDGPIASTTTPGTPSADYEDRVAATGLDAGIALFLANAASTVEVVPTEPAVRPAALTRPTTIRPLALAPLTTAIAPAVDGLDGLDGTVGVVVDGLISQTTESGVDALAKAAEDRGLGKGAGTSWDAFKAGKKVWEALDANEIIAAALGEIDALEDCAKNPTNALTKQQYASDSAAQEKAVDTVAAARAQIKVSAAVLFSSLVADTGSGLVAEAPWLGFLVSPAVNYTKDSLVTAIKSEVDRAKAAVVPCRPNAYKISGKLPSAPAGIVVTGEVCRLDREFVAMLDGDYVGRMTFVPDNATGGSMRFKGKLGIAPLNAVGHGDYTVTLSDDGSAGAIDLPFTSTIKIPKPGTDQTRTHPVHLTLTQMPPCEEVD